MSFYMYTYDSVTRRPHVSDLLSTNLLLADGTVGLTATWNVGAQKIQSSATPTVGNDLTNKTYVDSQVSALAGPFGAKNAFAGVANGADPASVGIGARFLVVSAYSTYSIGDVIEQITSDPTFSAATVNDGDVYVAKTSLTGSTAVTSDSSTIDDGEITVWDSTTSKWVTVGSIIAIPDATSASGGGTKGKVTFDSDKGLTVTSGVAEVNIDTTTLGFAVSGNTGSIYVKESGLDHALLGNLDSTNYYHLTQANHIDLTDGGDSTLHYHVADRDRSNHTGTQLASTISDFAEAAQDAAASMWVTTDSHTAIDFSYNDSTNQMTASVAYDNVTIGVVGNQLTVLNSGETSVSYTNNTGSQIDAGTVVALSTTVAGEVVVADASNIDKADARGVVKANIANGASGLVIVGGDATVLTDVSLNLGKWVYVGGGAAAGKASIYDTGSYYTVKLGLASATNKVALDKQWIG